MGGRGDAGDNRDYCDRLKDESDRLPRRRADLGEDGSEPGATGESEPAFAGRVLEIEGESGMRLGLCFDGFYSITEMVELAGLADEAGMDSIWMSGHLCFCDSVASSMGLLTTTRRIEIVPAPLITSSLTPTVSAIAVGT